MSVEKYKLQDNLSHNQGQYEGLLVIQTNPRNGEAAIKAIDEGIAILDQPDTDPKLKLIPVITNEFDAYLLTSTLKSNINYIGSIASFGRADYDFCKYKNRTHLAIVAHEYGQQNADFLFPLIRLPRTGLRRNISKFFYL